MGGEFEAGSVVGRMELALEGWKKSVEAVKSDLAEMAKASGLSTTEFSSLKGVISGLGVSLKSELEAKLKAAEAALVTFKNSGQLTAEGQKKLEANIQGLKNELAGMTGETPKVESLWKQFAIGEIVVGLAHKALSVVKDVLADSINEAADYEKSIKGLNSAFELSGRNMPGMVQNLRDYADELQALGLADDGAILKSESLLLQITHLNESGIKAAVRGALGLVEVYGGDLQSATEAVGRAYEGNYRALGQMIPAIRNATTDEERHSIMMVELEKAYQRAVASTETYSGQVKKLGLEWTEAKKQLGEAILDTGILQKAMSGLTVMLDFATGGTKAWKAAQREGISAVNDFRISLEFVKPSMEDMRKAIEDGPEKWEAYKKGIKATDDMLKANKDTVIAWVKDGTKFIENLFAQQKGFNDTGKAVVGYTQEFIKARGDIQAQIAAATLSEYEAERQNLIRTAQLKIEDSKASGMRETERIEYEKLQNQALAVSLQDLARKQADKMAEIRSGLTTQILKATSTEFEAERRVAELEYLAQEKNIFEQIGATKDFYTWKELARKALDIKLHEIDVKEANDRFAIDTEILNATKEKDAKDLAGMMANLRDLSNIESLKQKAKLSTLDYSIWAIGRETDLKIQAVALDGSLTEQQKNNKIKVLIETADAEKALAIKEADVIAKLNEQVVANFISTVADIIFSQKPLLESFEALSKSIFSMWLNTMVNIVEEGMKAGDSIKKIFDKLAEAATSPIGLISLGLSMIVNSIKQVEAEVKRFNEKALSDYKQHWELLDAIHGKILSISDDTAKELLRLTKQFGAAGAEARLLGQIMQDTGINASNFDLYMGKATNTLTLMEKGMLDVETGTALADEQFDVLLEAAKKLGKEGTAGLVNFIATSRQMGLEIASVTKYVDEQLGVVRTKSQSAADGLQSMAEYGLAGYRDIVEQQTEAAKSLATEQSKLATAEGDLADFRMAQAKKVADLQNKIAAEEDRDEKEALKQKLMQLVEEGNAEEAALLKSVKDHNAAVAIIVGDISKLDAAQGKSKEQIAADFDLLANQTMAVFGSMVANGATYEEAMNSIGPALDALSEKQKILGGDGNAAIAQLLHIRDVENAHKDLFAAVSGNDAVLKALANTGFLTAESLDGVADQAAHYYDQLIAAGLTSDEALRQMGPTLADINKYAEVYGITLDENALKLIEDAKKAGLLKEEVDMGEEAQTTNKLLGDMRDIFVAIADKLGIVLGKVGNFEDEIDKVPGALDNWTDSIYTIGGAFETAKGKVREISGAIDTVWGDLKNKDWGIDVPINVEQSGAGSVPSYDVGAYPVPETQLAVVHKGEFIIPPEMLAEMVNGWSRGSQPTEAAGAPIYVENRITINALDGASVEKLFRTKGREIIDDMFRRNAKGLTTNLNLYLARQGA